MYNKLNNAQKTLYTPRYVNWTRPGAILLIVHFIRRTLTCLISPFLAYDFLSPIVRSNIANTIHNINNRYYIGSLGLTQKKSKYQVSHETGNYCWTNTASWRHSCCITFIRHETFQHFVRVKKGKRTVLGWGSDLGISMHVQSHCNCCLRMRAKCCSNLLSWTLWLVWRETDWVHCKGFITEIGMGLFI